MSADRRDTSGLEAMEQVSWRRFLGAKVAWAILLAFGLAAAGTFTFGYQYEYQRATQEAHEDLEIQVGSAASEIEELFSRHREAIRFLRRLPPIDGLLRTYQNGGEDPIDGSTLELWEGRLQQIFTGFIQTNPAVYQVRYIGVADEGKELVRVERQGDQVFVVPRSKLQEKGHRDYFQTTVLLNPGQVYVSSINLNREHRSLQRPHLPTIRFATPVLDDEGDVFGIVVTNVDVRGLLNRLGDERESHVELYVADADGSFIVHPDMGQTFGADLDRSARFSETFKGVSPPRPNESRVLRFDHDAASDYLRLKSVPFTPFDDRALYVAALVPEAYVSDLTWGSMTRGLLVIFGLGAVVFVLAYVYWSSTQRSLLARDARLRLGAIVQGSSEAIVGLDLKGRIESWNRAAERMFGFAENEVLGKSVDKVVQAEGRSQSFDLYRALAAGSKQRRYRRRDESSFDAEVAVSAVSGSNNEIMGAALLVRDVSEQKLDRERIEALNANLEQEVRERTEKLASAVELQRAIFSSAGYAIVATNREGVITRFNRAAEELFGYRAEDVENSQSAVMLHDASEVSACGVELSKLVDRPIEGFSALAAYADSQGASEQEWTMIRKDRSTFPALVRMTPLHDEHERIMGYLKIVVDQSRVVEREEALRRAQQEAELANQAKSQFLANMSHEIRTPMNAVQGMLQLVFRTRLTHEQRDYVAKAQAGAKTLLSILNDVLDYSKIEAGKMTISPEPFRLDALLRELGAMVAVNLGDRDVDLLYDIEPGIPHHLVSDPLRLQQVLLNLVSNAVKFTESGEIVVSVRMENSANQRRRLVISVRDTGVGMSEEQLQAVFESFMQAESSTTRKYGGTGLGLAISRRLVELLGGELTVESSPGKGSTFRFFIPVEVVSSSSALQAGEDSDNAIGQLRVLVVDQNPTSRRILGRMVKTFDWVPTVVSTWSEAEQKVLSVLERPDVVIADHREWGRSASELLSKVRGVTTRPTVILTQQEIANLESNRDAVIDGHVVKPVTGSTLFNAVLSARFAKPISQKMTRNPDRVPRLSGVRVLVVEDVPVNQQIAQALLTQDGAVVTIAGGGLEALAMLRENPSGFDIVLMDVQMPDLDGLDTTGRIRGQLNLTDLPIIAMTANAMNSDRYACLSAGMNDHIGKPFHIDEVVARIQQYTANSKHGEGADERPVALTPLLHGDDFQVAIACFGGDTRLFVEQSRVFLRDHRHDLAAIWTAIDQEKWDLAASALHSLKGLSGTFGAKSLSALAGQMQTRILARDWEEFDSLKQRLTHTFETALLQLEELIDELEPGLHSQELSTREAMS